MKQGREKTLLLRKAKRITQVRVGVRKEVVFIAAAKMLGVPPPVTHAMGYAMLALLQERFKAGGEQKAPKPQKKAHQPRVPFVRADFKASGVASVEFLSTYQWRRLRMEVLKERGSRCECCGATPKDGVRMNVDHIKPRLRHPELALEKTNLQVLCEVCNHGKGNWDETDWRQRLA